MDDPTYEQLNAHYRDAVKQVARMAKRIAELEATVNKLAKEVVRERGISDKRRGALRRIANILATHNNALTLADVGAVAGAALNEDEW